MILSLWTKNANNMQFKKISIPNLSKSRLVVELIAVFNIYIKELFYACEEV